MPEFSRGQLQELSPCPRHAIVRLAIVVVVLLGRSPLVGSACSEEPVVAQRNSPHIVLILTDDMGWMDLRVQGNEILRTPHIDRLAARGTRFTNAYAAAPVCSPTRAALMTGLAPARLQITQHGADGEQFWPAERTIQPPVTRTALPTGAVTVAERLRKQGYATGFFGKWHLGNDREQWPRSYGFDINIGGCGFGGPPTYWDPYRIPTIEPREEGEYLTDRLADEAIAWMRNQSQPVFLCLWTYNPHYPFEAPEDLTAHYEGKEGPGLKNPIYGGQIEATDRAIGRVLHELNRLGRDDETLVIMTSDNGGWSGATDNRPLRAGKGFLYEGGLRVPLIVAWPGEAQAGKPDHTPVISMDLTATILDAAGAVLAGSDPLDGVSLRGLLQGKALGDRDLYWHYPHWAFHKQNRPGCAIRHGDFKLIRRYDDNSLELYNLRNDIGEQTNLATEQGELAQQLNARLSDWLEQTSAGLPARR